MYSVDDEGGWMQTINQIFRLHHQTMNQVKRGSSKKNNLNFINSLWYNYIYVDLLENFLFWGLVNLYHYQYLLDRIKLNIKGNVFSNACINSTTFTFIDGFGKLFFKGMRKVWKETGIR